MLFRRKNKKKTALPNAVNLKNDEGIRVYENVVQSINWYIGSIGDEKPL